MFIEIHERTEYLMSKINDLYYCKRFKIPKRFIQQCIIYAITYKNNIHYKKLIQYEYNQEYSSY